MDTICITLPKEIQDVSMTGGNTLCILQCMEWYDRAKARAKELGVTQEQIADWLELTRGAVGHYLSGRREPEFHDLKIIALRLGMTLDELLNGTPAGSQVRTFHPDDGIPDDVVLIKESEVRFKGGNGHILDYEIIEESEPATYRLSWFQKEKIKPERTKRFKVVGDSNEPFLFSGDTILVHLDETQVTSTPKFYAFWQEGEGRRVKKLLKKIDGTLIIRSINDREYPEEVVSPEMVAEKIIIIGRVRDKSGRGGL